MALNVQKKTFLWQFLLRFQKNAQIRSQAKATITAAVSYLGPGTICSMGCQSDLLSLNRFHTELHKSCPGSEQ